MTHIELLERVRILLRIAKDQLYKDAMAHTVGLAQEQLEKCIAQLEAQERAVPQGLKLVPVELLKQVEDSLGSFVSDHGWSQSDMDTRDNVSAIIAAAPSAPVRQPLETVHGDVLPPIGSRVYILHGRDDETHACIVTGYYAWGDLKGNKRLHRLFVRMVYEGTNTENARMLCDCYATADSAIAHGIGGSHAD